MPRSEIEEEIARATHEWRDHAVDGTPLGAEPICNCYQYARALTPLLNRVRAEAIRTALDGAVLMMGDAGVTVYDSREHYDAGHPRPLPIRDWLRHRADRIERGETA